VRAEHLNDLPGALEAYRRALAIDTNQAESRQALAALLSHEDTVTRLEAADILAPLLEMEGSHESLLGVLEVQAQSSDDPSVQLEKLTQALQVAERELDAPERAMGFAVRGAKLAGSQGDVSAWLEPLERLAARTNGQRAHVELLEAVCSDLFDAGQQLLVQKRVASLYENELANSDAAILAYVKALELEADDLESLVALERLYEKADCWRSRSAKRLAPSRLTRPSSTWIWTRAQSPRWRASTPRASVTMT
jgi:tetratricopeptide (TPR) repeat protein